MGPLDDDLRELVEQNLGLVRKLAASRKDSVLPLDDLVQAGTIGLMRAVQLYDPERAAFSTYACRWILQAMGTAERGASVVYVSGHGHRMRRHGRDGGKAAAALAAVVEYSEETDARPEEEPETDRRDSAEWVRRAVAKLGEVERDLIISRYWDGDKLKTMARRHGFTTSRADQRLDHAIEELRYMLEPEYAKGA